MSYNSTSVDYNVGYVYGYMVCYYQKTECNAEDFINELCQVCDIKFTLELLDEILEIIADSNIITTYDGKFVEFCHNEQFYRISLDSDNQPKIERVEINKPWCYENNKNAVCNCAQPCELPTDDDDEEVEIVVKRIIYDDKKYLMAKNNGEIFDYDEYVKNNIQVSLGYYNDDHGDIYFHNESGNYFCKFCKKHKNNNYDDVCDGNDKNSRCCDCITIDTSCNCDVCVDTKKTLLDEKIKTYNNAILNLPSISEIIESVKKSKADKELQSKIDKLFD